MSSTQLVDAEDPRGLRHVAVAFGRQAEDGAKHAERLGRRHRRTHFGVQIFAVLAGVVAGVSGIAEGAPLLTGVAGFTASGLAGVQTRLNAEALAQFHFVQSAGYGAIGRRFEVLAEGPDELTADQINALVERLLMWQARKVGDQTLP